MHPNAAILKRIGSLEILAAGVFVLSSLGVARAAEQPVNWMRTVNVAVRGNTLQKTGGCDGCDDAGAVSRQIIRSGDGYEQFRVTDPNAFWLAGLTRPGGGLRFNDMDFAFRFNGNGWADVLENGSYQPDSDTEANRGDVFRIAIVGGRVQYLKNGELIYESRRAPRYPLALGVSLGTVGARIADARIEPNSRGLLTDNQSGDYYDYDSRTLANLDRNRDGMISRNEWPGNLREFARLDTNGDNRVSRFEMSRGLQNVPGSIGTSGRQVIVDPRRPWTNTGVWVQAGDMVSFDADGTIVMSDNPGDTSSPVGSDRLAQDAPMRGRAAGTLLARIGNSAPIAVGSRRTVRAPVGGEVFLGVNDDHLPDNSGEYRVLLTVEPR